MKDRITASMKPSLLRLLLSISMILVAGATVVGFILVQKQLSAYAVEVSHIKVDASGSEQSLATLQTLEKELERNRDVILKATSLKHVSDLPQFQAIEDMQNHAKANNLQLKNVTFSSNEATPVVGTAPAPSTPATTPPATQSDGINVTFTLADGLNDGSVNIDEFLNFLYDIEHSIPKMQVQGISVGGKGSTRVTVEPITVKMFTK